VNRITILAAIYKTFKTTAQIAAIVGESEKDVYNEMVAMRKEGAPIEKRTKNGETVWIHSSFYYSEGN
jgi:biotin operon repressor